MIRNSIWIFCFSLTWMSMCSLRAQDLHFSQFFQSPLSTNPANTGFIPDADFRIGTQYRQQYSNLIPISYKTFTAFVDGQLFNDQIDNGWLGAGLMIMSDVAGSGSLTSNKIYGSLAYHQMLGNASLLSAGFNLGYANKRINTSLLNFPDQFNGFFFDSNLPTGVQLSSSAVQYFDMQAGINYAYFPSEEIYINAGYSIHHVNRPRETFLNDRSDNGIIPMRQIGFVNAVLKLNDDLLLKPNIYYTRQASAQELTFGLMSNYRLTESGDKILNLGCYARNKDAIIPMLGFQLHHLELNFSFDITTSTLRSYNYGSGATEFSLIKKGFFPGRAVRQTLCPTL